MCFPPAGVLCTEVLAAHLFWQLGDECLQVEPGTYHPRVLLFRPVWAHAPCASFAVHRCGLGRELGRGVLHSSEKLRLMRRPCGVASQQSPADDHSVTESCAAFVCAKSKGFQICGRSTCHCLRIPDTLRVCFLRQQSGRAGRTAACNECEGLLLREDLRVLCGSLTAEMPLPWCRLCLGRHCRVSAVDKFGH